MHSDILTRSRYHCVGLVLCYIIFFANLLLYIALLVFKPLGVSPYILEQHHLYIFLFIVTSGCLLSKYKNQKFFRTLGWYAGFIILLTCLLLFIEEVIYSNYITAYFDINEQTSPLSTLCFMFISFSLLDLAMLKTTPRIAIVSGLLIFLSLAGMLLNLLSQNFISPMPIYTAVNFILLATSFLFLLSSTYTPKIAYEKSAI